MVKYAWVGKKSKLEKLQDKAMDNQFGNPYFGIGIISYKKKKK